MFLLFYLYMVCNYLFFGMVNFKSNFTIYLFHSYFTTYLHYIQMDFSIICFYLFMVRGTSVTEWVDIRRQFEGLGSLLPSLIFRDWTLEISFVSKHLTCWAVPQALRKIWSSILLFCNIAAGSGEMAYCSFRFYLEWFGSQHAHGGWQPDPLLASVSSCMHVVYISTYIKSKHNSFF